MRSQTRQALEKSIDYHQTICEQHKEQANSEAVSEHEAEQHAKLAKMHERVIKDLRGLLDDSMVMAAIHEARENRVTRH